MNPERVMAQVKHAQRMNLRMWLRRELIATTQPLKQKALIEAMLKLDQLSGGVPPCGGG